MRALTRGSRRTARSGRNHAETAPSGCRSGCSCGESVAVRLRSLLSGRSLNVLLGDLFWTSADGCERDHDGLAVCGLAFVVKVVAPAPLPPRSQAATGRTSPAGSHWRSHCRTRRAARRRASPSPPDEAPDRNEPTSYSSRCRWGDDASENIGLDMRATREPFGAASSFLHDWCVWMLP